MTTTSSSNNNVPAMEIVGLPSPLERDNRRVPRMSSRDFGIFILGIVPLWLVFVVPLIIVSQLFRILSNMVSQPPKKAPVDSGFVVKPEDIKLRQERKFDIVVLGFTGFTGRLAARHLAKAYGVNQSIKWAVAGRSPEKLAATKQCLADELGMPELNHVPVIVCDTQDSSTLPSLVQDTRCVATTAGPFARYGTPVVEACAKYGTHYVDITGEVGWVKSMIVAFQGHAQTTGAKIVHFCGHDSVPWDLTCYKLNKLLKDKFDDDLETVKIWDEIIGMPSGGTYETTLMALEGRATYAPKCKVDPFLQLPHKNGEKSTHTTQDNLPLLLDPFVNGMWTSPFVMAIVNAKVVRWTHAFLQQGAPTLTYREVKLCADFKTAVGHYFGPLIGGSLLLSPITKWLAYRFQLLPQPGEGPSMASMEKENYLLVTAEGKGANGNRAESTLYFKQDAGYLETSKMLVESGLCLALTDESKLISKDKGGFYPPAAAMGDALLDRLVKQGAEWNSRSVAKSEDEEKLKEIKESKYKTT